MESSETAAPSPMVICTYEQFVSAWLKCRKLNCRELQIRLTALFHSGPDWVSSALTTLPPAQTISERAEFHESMSQISTLHFTEGPSHVRIEGLLAHLKIFAIVSEHHLRCAQRGEKAKLPHGPIYFAWANNICKRVQVRDESTA